MNSSKQNSSSEMQKSEYFMVANHASDYFVTPVLMNRYAEMGLDADKCISTFP